MTIRRLFIFLLLMLATVTQATESTGLALIEASLSQHASPIRHYEEQSLITTDRQGNITVRTLRSYSIQDDLIRKNLRQIETPRDAKGTAITIVHNAEDNHKTQETGAQRVFGSNFTIADLTDENPKNFRYEKERDQVVDRNVHYVVRATPINESVARRTGYQDRKIYLRKDNLFISRIYYLDKQGKTIRRQSFRDPHSPPESNTWLARMILMEDLREGEQSLLKIDRHVNSPDYIPAHLFAGSRSTP